MLIIQRGGTFLPTPGHVRVKVQYPMYVTSSVNLHQMNKNKKYIPRFGLALKEYHMH